MPDTMINPKHSEKNNAATNQHAHQYREISDIAAGDGTAGGSSYRAHSTDHRKKEAGWSYYGGYRDRHDGEVKQ